MPTKTADLLTLRAVADNLGFTRHHVRRLIWAGELRAVKLNGWRVDPIDLDAFKAARMNRQPTPASKRSTNTRAAGSAVANIPDGA